MRICTKGNGVYISEEEFKRNVIRKFFFVKLDGKNIQNIYLEMFGNIR